MIELILVLVIIGVLLYLLQSIPMDPTIKLIIRIVVIIVVILWLIQIFGLDLPLPHLRR